MKFAAGNSFFAVLGVTSLMFAGIESPASAQGTAQNIDTAKFMRRAADLRTPTAPEPLGGGGGQVGSAISAAGDATGLYTVALRLGAAVTPRTRFIGGVDITLPSLSLGKGFSTRIDIDAIVSANFGGVSTLIPVMFNQVYSKGLIGGSRVYVGAGIGPNFGEITRFGGKIFVGGDIGKKLGLELDVYFPGFDEAYVGILARLPFSF